MATVARETVIRENLLIGGQRRPARSGRYFETVNPADERVIALVAEADVSDIDAAVASAREALEGEWGHLRAAERGEALRRLADLVRRHEDELVALESLDSGKPVTAIRRQDWWITLTWTKSRSRAPRRSDARFCVARRAT